MPDGPPLVFSLRLPGPLVRRVDRVLASMRELTPGATYSRSDALRVLLLAGLSRYEAAHVVTPAEGTPAIVPANEHDVSGTHEDTGS